MNLNIGIPEPQAEDAHSDTSGFSNAEWARHHIEQLATADSEAEYDRRAESALARHTNIAVNGSQVSKANYRSQWGAAFSAVGEVRIHCAIETPQLSIHMCQVCTRFRSAGSLLVFHKASLMVTRIPS